MNKLINAIFLKNDNIFNPNIKLIVNGYLYTKVENLAINYFSSWKRGLANIAFKDINIFENTKALKVFSFLTTGRHDDVLEGLMPTGRNIEIHQMMIIKMLNDQVIELTIFYDRKSLEDQICPEPNYEIDKRVVFNDLHGNASKIYQLLMSTRRNFTDSKYELVHALRKSVLRAPDLSLLNHDEISHVKANSECQKKLIVLDSGQSIELFTYTEKGQADNPHLPTLLYLHGGGWSIGSPEGYDLTNRKLAISTGMRVICPRYRLAPEYPFPAGFEDCCNVYMYLREGKTIENIKYNTKFIAVAGDSVGGGFAAALTLKMHDIGATLPDAVLLFSPATDLRLENYHAYNHYTKNNIMIDQALIALIRGIYVDGGLWDHPYVSPMRGNLSHFPPTFIMIGEEDPLYDENICFAQKVTRESQHASKVVIGHGMPHHYHTFLGLSDEVEVVYKELRQFITEVLVKHTSKTTTKN